MDYAKLVILLNELASKVSFFLWREENEKEKGSGIGWNGHIKKKIYYEITLCHEESTRAQRGPRKTEKFHFIQT